MQKGDYNKKDEIFEMILENPGDHAAVIRATPVGVHLADDWQVCGEEGQLAVDVMASAKEVIIISTMAGADTGSIEVYVQGDLLTIRGYRPEPILPEIIDQKFYQECFWGKFSRSIVLPIEVKSEMARAEYKNGVLIVRVPKKETDARIPITIVEE